MSSECIFLEKHSWCRKHDPYLHHIFSCIISFLVILFYLIWDHGWNMKRHKMSAFPSHSSEIECCWWFFIVAFVDMTKITRSIFCLLWKTFHLTLRLALKEVRQANIIKVQANASLNWTRKFGKYINVYSKYAAYKLLLLRRWEKFLKFSTNISFDSLELMHSAHHL